MANDHSSASGISRTLHVAGILAATATALPCFFTKTESLRSAITGAGESSNWVDRLSALGFAIGGLHGADWARATCLGIPILAAFLLIPYLTKKLPGEIQAAVSRIMIVVALALIGFGIFETFQSRSRDVCDIRLLAPVDLLKTVDGGSSHVFLNSPALSAARLIRPGLAMRAPDESTSKILERSPAKWREEDRRSPFDAALLATPLEDSRPLVETLMSLPGWHLAYIDNQGLLFLRGDSVSTPVKSDFSCHRDTALFNAQKAMVMHFLGENKTARELMQEARAAEPRDPLVLVQSATLAAAFKQWPTVRKDAESALEANPSSVQAHYLLALALLETGSLSRASETIASLCSNHSQEPSVLWLAARIAHETNDPAWEIASLERLLTLAKHHQEEPTVIHIHLAQAWAKRGFAAQAIENYNAALQGNLNPDQRGELESTKKMIESRSSRH